MAGAEENRENVDDFSRDVMNKNGEEDEDMELSLGLSMNGRFGVDPARKKLRRSSSVSDVVVTINLVDDESDDEARARVGAPLARASSLPTETAECHRRKEGPTRKRMEKMKNVVDGLHEGANGAIKTTMTKSSSSRKIPQEPVVQRPAGRAPDGVVTEEELLRNTLLDMPYVSTKGIGPNCKKIEGFLYRYRMGEEVKIVCVCHGMFLTPAEFVKHGGGGDVAHPLKHIVVNPFPLY